MALRLESGRSSSPLSDRATAAHDALAGFQPLVRAWFHERLGEPTEPQIAGWPLVRKAATC